VTVFFWTIAPLFQEVVLVRLVAVVTGGGGGMTTGGWISTTAGGAWTTVAGTGTVSISLVEEKHPGSAEPIAIKASIDMFRVYGRMFVTFLWLVQTDSRPTGAFLSRTCEIRRPRNPSGKGMSNAHANGKIGRKTGTGRGFAEFRTPKILQTTSDSPDHADL